tara:strand:+ start:464 stop:1660 length:1197 start_codon:yes stop_codon:yes gene_type:complete
MKNHSLTLYLEINGFDYIFFVGEIDEEGNFKITYKLEFRLKDTDNTKNLNSENIFDEIKKNVYLIEQKIGHTFNEVVLILENFNPTFINLTGYKKLNGSRVLRENITYILNTLKSCVYEAETKKTVIHIFNSKFYLDNKKINNLPIGLFGEFYSHELGFTLIDTNKYIKLQNIFDLCNLKVKKMITKSFIEGANTSDNFKNIDTFFQIRIKENESKIFYFENDSLKFEQNFKFGSNIILKDISKITSLSMINIQIILEKIDFNDKLSDDELIEEKYFEKGDFKAIKKKLIYEIALARIKEISELLFFNNLNLSHYNKGSKVIFFDINNKSQSKSLDKIFEKVFSSKCDRDFKILNNVNSENLLITANKLVHFGWKKEAIPIASSKKSFIASIFDTFFG